MAFGFDPLLDAPSAAPTVILAPINSGWITHLEGLASQMLQQDYWTGDAADIADAIDQVDALILALMGDPSVLTDAAGDPLWDTTGDFLRG